MSTIVYGQRRIDRILSVLSPDQERAMTFGDIVCATGLHPSGAQIALKRGCLQGVIHRMRAKRVNRRGHEYTCFVYWRDPDAVPDDVIEESDSATASSDSRLTGAKIVFGKRTTDQLMEVIPAGRENALTLNDIRERMPDRDNSILQQGLRTLVLHRLVRREPVQRARSDCRGRARSQFVYWREA